MEEEEEEEEERKKKKRRNTQKAKGKTKANFRELRSVHQDSEDKSS